MRDIAELKRKDGEKTQLPTGVSHQLTQLSAVITCLRSELNKDLPIQHIALLLAVVQQPGVSMQDLMGQLNMPQGSVSRNVKLLSTTSRGYNLLRTEQGLANRKQVVVHPTPKCVTLVEKLCQLLHVGREEDVTHVCRCAG